ncbi:YjcQ family protein [Clostridium perfringens]|nr:hypothetical protein [Clostridium perfringens]MDK0531104.1 YjcQ family protein [Clostridium perfringens]
METKKNNIKDNMRISYIIREMSKELERINGNIPDIDWVENNVIDYLSEDEYVKIVTIMVEGDLIKGCQGVNFQDFALFDENIKDMRITVKGIEFLNR